MGFKFSLQSVLDYRMITEETKKLEYQEAQSVLNNQLLTIQQLETELNKVNEYLMVSGVVNITELHHLTQYRDVLRTQIEHVMKEKKKQEQVVNKAQGALVTAKKDVQVLETLKDKKEEQFKQLENQKEIRQLDEFASIKFGR